MATLPFQQASVAARLSKHFHWRLGHALVADVIASSIANGLIEAIPFESKGTSCLRFRLSESAADKTDHELVRSIRSVEQVVLGLGPRHRFIYEDGEVVIDEYFTPVRVKRSGASEISLQIKSPTEGKNLTTCISSDWVDLVELINRKAVRPSAGDLAALLLLDLRP